MINKQITSKSETKRIYIKLFDGSNTIFLEA